MWDDVKKARTFTVPGMTPKGKAVLMLLASHKGIDGLCNPSVTTLSAESLFSPRCVKRALEELKRLGVIAVESRTREGRTNRYALDLSPRCHADTPGECQTRARARCQTEPQPVPNPRADGVRRAPEVRRSKEEDTNKGLSVCKSAPPHAATLAKGVVTCEAAMKLCYELGASRDEARTFWLYNQLRNWAKLGPLTLRELAEAWVLNYRRRDPEGWAYEQEQRRRAREERERRALYARIQQENQQP